MNVALVGSSGYIAEFLIKRFNEEKDIESILKLDKNGSVDIYIDLLKPTLFDYSVLADIDYVVFTAAISGPDRCAADFEFCWDINVTGTTFFIEKALEQGCRVLFFSSDAVFKSLPGKIYDEKSETAAYTPYGRMKKAVEDRFRDNPCFKAIRLSYVVSVGDRFTAYCLDCMRDGAVAEIFHPFYRNVISAGDTADVVMYFAFHWNEFQQTFFNAAGNELVSRIRIADEINQIADGKLRYTISKPHEGFFLNRPSVTQMKSLYAQKYGILKNNSFTEKIQKELERFKL